MEGQGSNLLQVVERQCRRWVLQQESQRTRKPVHWPVITVSREFGARGEAMARRLAAETGFSLWDDELVHTIAAQSGASERVLRTLDEHLGSAIEDSINGALLGGQHMNSEYFRSLVKLVHRIAQHGGSIIVGRGAQYVLEAEPVLRVRVVSPLAERIRGYGEREGLEEHHARKKVEREDHRRRSFVRRYFSRDVTVPSDYDVVVNTATLGLDRAPRVVLAAYEAKFGRRPPVPRGEGYAQATRLETTAG